MMTADEPCGDEASAATGGGANVDTITYGRLIAEQRVGIDNDGVIP
jgi:hypothetical protein